MDRSDLRTRREVGGFDRTESVTVETSLNKSGPRSVKLVKGRGRYSMDLITSSEDGPQ